MSADVPHGRFAEATAAHLSKFLNLALEHGGQALVLLIKRGELLPQRIHRGLRPGVKAFRARPNDGNRRTSTPHPWTNGQLADAAGLRAAAYFSAELPQRRTRGCSACAVSEGGGTHTMVGAVSRRWVVGAYLVAPRL